MAAGSGDKTQGALAPAGAAGSPSLRLDKWLWFARFFTSRSLASEFCAGGRIRIGHRIIAKAHHPVRPGDVLTFPLSGRVRIVKVKALAARRGPAAVARELYEDLSPPAKTRAGEPEPVAKREKGAGRPTKTERRAIARLMGRS
ncbi:MAG TPA: RNA-binding S4 domain-containing protein [Alphaproteobacteria bacterium]|nr:RNA-binding S4 domain-containing protein [Alphaproteobacteria bacterium]